MGASKGEGEDSKGKDPFCKGWMDPERMTGTQFEESFAEPQDNSDQEEVNLRQGCDRWGDLLQAERV